MRVQNSITASLIASALTFGSISAGQAQTPNSVVGVWKLVSSVNTSTDGSKTDAFGAHPVGMAIFTADGSFIDVLTTATLPKFASNNRMQGTPEENKAIVQGSIFASGTYSVSTDLMTLHVTGSSWAYWIGTDQKRPIAFDGDTMSWTLAAPIGGSSVVTWERVK